MMLPDGSKARVDRAEVVDYLWMGRCRLRAD